jgi:polysaccharide biosynthesis protein PslH
MTVGESRPRLLILGHLLPWPLDSGVAVRAFNTWKRLAEHFQLRILCFTRNSRQRNAAAVATGVERLGEFAQVEAFPLRWDRPALRAVPHLESLVMGRAYTHFEYASRQFADRVREWGSSAATDLVHIESLDLAPYLPLVQAPLLITHHNVESLLLERRAARTGNPAVRSYLRLQGRRIRDDERKWLPRAALNVAVSYADAEALAVIASGSRLVVAPNGVDTTSIFPSSQPSGKELAFLGGLDWFPNRDALEYYVEAIEPELRRLLGEVTLRWVGAAGPSSQVSSAMRGIRFTGFVPDPAAALAGAGCFIVPLRVGGGTRLKILEAWGLGLPVVSTTVGCEGLQVRAGDNILIADTPGDFAKAVSSVLGDRDLWARLSRAGRETAVRSYDWGKIVDDLATEYLGVSRRRGLP